MLKIIVAAVLIGGSALGVVAQEPPVTETQLSTRSTAQLREILSSGDASEVDAARLELETVAETDASAAFVLAEIYRKGTPLVAKNIASSVPLYEFAGAEGNSLAWRILGDLYRRSDEAGLPASDAFAFYEKAALAGDIQSTYRLGEYYRTGVGGVERNSALALKEHLIAAQAGFEFSYIRVADLLRSSGEKSVEAIEWYKKAGEAGDQNAFFALGEIYRKGDGVAVDPKTAASFYTTALENGVQRAALPLANLYVTGLLGNGNEVEGVSLLQQAVSENVNGARVALANAYFRGTGTSKDVESGLKVLQEGVEAFDTAAARQLIRVYTEGRLEGVRKDVARAEQVLTSMSSQFDDREKSYETLIVQVAGSSSQLELENVHQLFSKLEDRDKSSALLRSYVLSPNVFVALIQAVLKERKIFTGSVNGLLTASTIRAVNAFCDDAGIADQCRFGPLRADTRTSLAGRLFP